jgi:membrane-bound lytic murein transglycosylase F
VSLPQQISWAVRKNSPSLLNALNQWLEKIKKEPTFMVVYNRYFKSPRTSLMRMQSDYSSLGGNKLSPYDNLIKNGAEKLGWDWRLLAAVICQESGFKPDNESWAGARGLMQLMPATAKQLGVADSYDPRQNIRGGVKYLQQLNKYWSKTIFNQEERLKFVLASYNAGLTHVADAQRLAEKYDKDPTRWENSVEEFLLKKSQPAFYTDAMIRGGYCKCEEPIHYIKNILARYEEYKIHINS